MKLQILAALALLVPLAGCNNPAPTETAANNAATPNSSFKVALLTSGDVNDQGWNQLADDGLKAIKRELGAQTTQQVTKTAADREPALRDLADQGYDLIIAHGFEYGDQVKAVALKYPKVKFVVVAGNVQQAPNVATLVPKLEDTTYLLGMAAGGMTKSNVIGLIGGMKIPVIASTFDAFEKGAKSVNPKVKVLTNYVGNFEDQTAGREAARGQIAQGADFIFHNADQAGKGMFAAAKDAPGVLVFGSNRDQNSVVPDKVLASAVIEAPKAFVEIARDAQAGKFEPKFYILDLKSGDVAVHWNPKLKSKVPPALMQKIEEAAKRIKSGELQIERKV